MACLYKLLLLCGLFRYGSPIMCYECNSAINSLCADALLPDTLKRNCSEHDRGVVHTLCRKIVQHVDYGINGKLPESRVVRSCGWDETRFKGKCYHRAGYGGRQEVCSCITDYCNSSHRSTIAASLMATMVLVAVRNFMCE